jgi:hypothetical protein
MPKLADRATRATTIPCDTCRRAVSMGEALRWAVTFRLFWLLTGTCDRCQVRCD